MGSKWTVVPATDRIVVHIDDEDVWLEVKKELTIGEEKRLLGSGFRSLQGSTLENVSVNIDWDSMAFAKFLVYVTDWSLQDEKGNKLSLNLDTVRVLRPSVFSALEKAVDGYVNKVETERKKALSGEPSPQKISA